MRHRDVFAAVQAVEINVQAAFEGPVRRALKAEFPENLYTAWLEKLRLFGKAEGEWVLLAASRTAANWIEHNAERKLAEIMQRELGGELGVAIFAEAEVPEGLRALIQKGVNIRPLKSEPEQPGQPQTFETFCVGASNKAAYHTARAIAEGQAKDFPLVLLHGDPGRGKTHLLTAIHMEARRLNPSRRVRYIMAPVFIQEFLDGLTKKKDIHAFKALLRENDLLLIDDIHRIAGKPVTEEELLDTIEVVLSMGGQVALSADHGPQGLQGFADRVRAKMSGAIDCLIGEPDYELKRRIVQSRFKFYQAEEPGFEAPAGVIDLIAGRVSPSGRELDGAVRQLLMGWRVERAPITTQSAEAALRHKFAAPERRITVDHIIKCTAKFFNMSVEELLQRTRRQAIARPRQYAMYLCTELTSRSLPDIAKRFGGYDHTTVLYSRDRISELRADNPKIALEVDALKRFIEDSL